ncbi:MAG: YgiQ family radical SAM protein [Gammaproteobacteria bacterium]|nr:YgiQ family radical SAM protein [Gammaproteobacteria bacterium]
MTDSQAKHLFSYKKFWAQRFGIAPELPMTRAEMDALGWDSCDVIIVTGDAYIDHPSFGMAVIGRLLESQGFRVGILSQPDWNDLSSFSQLGRPNLFFGVAAGNMDSLVNHYTSDRKMRSDDAYTAGAVAGKRPDRATIVYCQKLRQVYGSINLVIGGIEASLRRIAHFDYWSDKVRHSILADSQADILLYGNAERAIVELAHRLAAHEDIQQIRDIRGTAYMLDAIPQDWSVINSTELDTPGVIEQIASPYQEKPACETTPSTEIKQDFQLKKPVLDRTSTVIRIPSFEQVSTSKPLYAHTSRVFHLETNPGNARALVQAHGKRYVWLNPPPIPLETAELDQVFELPFARQPHTSYGDQRIPAWEMIRHSVNIMRGCFGGCTFCSITEHEGRIIQSRSEESVIREIKAIRDSDPSFKGHISDVGGPTANMYRMQCSIKKIEQSCRRLSCVYPEICKNLNTDHTPLIKLYQRARNLDGIKRIHVASGLRYDLAVRSPEYIKELVTHHVGGYLKIAPEHSEEGPLSKMMKPGMGSYYQFKKLFDKFSHEAGKEQYLIPYFISAHPGTSDSDMLNLALWLKQNDFRLDQVQAFIPTPLAIASAMYHTGKNPLKRVNHRSEKVRVIKKPEQRSLHKAFLRYHDADNWPMLREALKNMGRSDLIGNGKEQLVPAWQPDKTTAQDKTGAQKKRPYSNNTASSRKPVASAPKRRNALTK